MKQIVLALHNYHDTYNLFPPGAILRDSQGNQRTVDAGYMGGNRDEDAMAPWSVLILPYMEQANLYNTFNMEGAWYSRFDYRGGTRVPQNYSQIADIGTVPSPQDVDSPNFYRCPSNPNQNRERYILTYYACSGGGLTWMPITFQDNSAMVENPTGPFYSADTSSPTARHFWNNGCMWGNSNVAISEIRDGTSNTIIMGETMYVGLRKVYTNFQSTPPGGPYHWTWSSGSRCNGDSSTSNSGGGAPNHSSICATYDGINNPTFTYTHQQALELGGAARAHTQQMMAYSSWHTGGAHMGFADGAIDFLSENLDLRTYRLLGPRADGLVLGEF
jgi:hypothetical protein